MQLSTRPNTTTLSYWLNWRVLLCVIWVLSAMVIACYIIWKYEGVDRSENRSKYKRRATPHQLPQLFHDDDAWRMCLKQIQPFWLLAFRVISFLLLLSVLLLDVVLHGAVVLYYYTQWTFTLVTIYFGIGSALSIYGCYQRYSIGRMFHGGSEGHGSYLPLSYVEATSFVASGEISGLPEERFAHGSAGVWGLIFQILFQVIAGAVVLTDCVYWFIIFPFLTLKNYDLSYMTYLMHSVNAVFLLVDTALNSLSFPWFRIAYFTLWTGVYVIFQWIIHACASIWWPYPFMDLSAPHAPLWYFLVGLMQIPCYGIFVLIVESKAYLLSRYFQDSNQYSR